MTKNLTIITVDCYKFQTMKIEDGGRIFNKTLRTQTLQSWSVWAVT